MGKELYTDGRYLEINPSWHSEESAWKAAQVRLMLQQHALTPATICEVGCGVGEVLNQLQMAMDPTCEFWGYDISPQAIALCQPRANDRLHFI
ncbi:MAG: methyltransferase domain-containing protein, partial [Ktedonobacterales bacterium]